MRKSATICLLSAVLAWPASSVAQDTADLVLRNGRFHTVSEAGTVDGSLAIKSGRIVYLGGTPGVAVHVGDDTKVIDLEGRAVTPGWIDAHSHLAGLGAALEQVDLVASTSYAEVIDRVRRAASAVPAGSWIQGRGWDQNDWADKRFPTHDALSDAVPDHPVWMDRIDGHAALLNARALAELGLTRDAEDPVGGRFARKQDGELTGVLIDRAKSVADRRPQAQPADIERWIVRGAEHCLARGLTTVTELGADDATLRAYERLRQTDRLPIRVSVFLSDEPELLDAWFERGPALDPEARLQTRAIKMYGDGALGSRGAALIEPYSDDPGNMGILITGSDHIAEVCERALATGFQIGTHTIGDRGALVALDGLERCFGYPRPEARFRIEHAQVMRLQDIERMADLGIIASFQPTHATSDMPWAEDRVGARRIQGAYAWRTALNAGARLALGSDFPVERASPMLGFHAAVTRQDTAGNPAGGWYPEQRLTRHEALSGFTLDAAYSLFLEDELGSIEPGKRADLVVFTTDPMTADASELHSLVVDMTILDGEVVHERDRS